MFGGILFVLRDLGQKGRAVGSRHPRSIPLRAPTLPPSLTESLFQLLTFNFQL